MTGYSLVFPGEDWNARKRAELRRQGIHPQMVGPGMEQTKQRESGLSLFLHGTVPKNTNSSGESNLGEKIPFFLSSSHFSAAILTPGAGCEGKPHGK